MTSQIRVFVVSVMLTAAVGTCHARSRGSLNLSDIDDLLARDKEISAQITADFDMFHVGVADMIDRSESVKLNGARIGPYRFPARPKGRPGPYTYEIIIETRATFIDKAGHPAPSRKAEDFKEEIKSILIR